MEVELCTFDGMDLLDGGGGPDALCAGGGDDFAQGGVGEDEIDGGDQNDELLGGPDGDQIGDTLGGGGYVIDGQAGYDYCPNDPSVACEDSPPGLSIVCATSVP